MTKLPFYVQENKKPLLIKGGEYWDSTAHKLRRGDVILDSGKITSIVPEWQEPFNGKVINASKCVLLPGLFDMHVHFREPGGEHKETILSGCQSAAAGGFTGVCPMPNTSPVIDNGELVRFEIDRAQGQLSRVYPIGAISKGLGGETLSEVGEMVKAGAVAISDDGHWVTQSGLMRRAFEYSRMFDIPIVSHAADPYLYADGVMHEGFYSTKLGLPGIPSVAETVAIYRDIKLAEYTGGRIHIAHLSTRGGVELIRRAKNDGIAVTGEVTPHHLCLTDESMVGYDTNFKMNPPVRLPEDKEALIEGIKDGAIDVIATDHAPHAIQEKEVEFIFAPFGCIGMESAFGVVYTRLLRDGTISFERAVELLIEQPRRILHIEIPSIQVGKPVDLIILNLDTSYVIKEDSFYSKSRNCPFIGWEVYGRVEGGFMGEKSWIRPEAEKSLFGEK